ncbi:MAG: DUF3494 domain-containing protein [Thiomicrospira sp.]|uniref:ice-binding family protein n=1 Tax=Thiomicrospira sp. TaxID=935 RepID=UPI001A0A853E|nr:ice-binding family protein [Thiomicrospira sp.]MBE0494027.1 DUF3494 domain-containing protein [Thiomicrospira sp.]
MNTIKKYTGRSLWLAGLMMTTLMAGCLGGGGSSSAPISDEDGLAASKVASTNPANGAVDVALNRSVIAIFDEDLDPTSVTDESFILKLNSAKIGGTVTYSEKVATFTPTSNLEAGQEYTATLTTGIIDLTGKPLSAQYEWSFTTGTTVAAGPAPINLGTAKNFVIMTAAGITSADGSAAITGNIGTSGITGASITVACTELAGGSEVFTDDAAYPGATCTSTDKTGASIALGDVLAAYTQASDPATPAGVGAALNIGAGTVTAQTFEPGVYTWGENVTITGEITLDGGANDVWVFQIGGTLDTNQAITLTGGAVAKNVFWRVADVVTLGTGAQFKGVILAKTKVDMVASSTIQGRLLAQTAVNLGSITTVTQPAE